MQTLGELTIEAPLYRPEGDCQRLCATGSGLNCARAASWVDLHSHATLLVADGSMTMLRFRLRRGRQLGQGWVAPRPFPRKYRPASTDSRRNTMTWLWSANSRTKTRGELRFRTSPLASVLMIGCALPVVLTLIPARLSGQISSTQLLHVTVTDQFGRHIVGLEQDNFEVLENGVLCSVANFAVAGSPMMLVIVSETPVRGIGTLIRPEDDLIQTRSIPDAVRQLSASTKPRKVIVATITSGTKAIPDGIQVLRTTPSSVFNAVDKLVGLPQYLLWIDSSISPASVKVVLNPPPDLPPLRVKWE